MSLKNLKASNKIVLLAFITLVLTLSISIYPKFDFTVNGTFVFPLFLSLLLFSILALIFFSREKESYSVSKSATLVTLSLIIFCIAINYLNFYASLSLVAFLNGLLFYKKNYLKILSHSCILIIAVFLVCHFFLGIELP